MQMDEHETTADDHQDAQARTVRKRRKRAPSRASRARSAITSGRQLFIDGDPNSAWSRRFHDLIIAHISDISAGQGANVLSAAQLTSLRQATSIECELERLQAMLSRGDEVDLEAFARTAGHLRRMWETLGLERRAKDTNDMASFLARRKRLAAVAPSQIDAEIEPTIESEIEPEVA
jgi:hypothetical protein